jgi:DNA repair protein RecO (recombination protein O)
MDGAGGSGRVTGALGFVLHTYPFRETSLIVEAFTAQHGRVAWVARGARRAGSALRGVLLPFQPMTAGWGGRGELRTLHKVEWLGGLAPLRGTPLVCGLYLNELLLRLLRREDPHERLFDMYRQSLADLAGAASVPLTLRRFERELLREIGYALLLDRDGQTGEAIDPQGRYEYRLGVGPVAVRGPVEGLELRGQTLLDLAQDRCTDAVSAQESKLLTRRVLAHYLGGQPLHTRDLLRALQNPGR